MQRPCDFCGQQYEAKTKASRFCEVKHRVAFHEHTKAGKPVPAADLTARASEKPKRTEVADRLERELRELGVFDHYEAATVLYLAEQLDSGAMVGTAFVSLSKELDRRVDALRLKADRPDDPVRLILTAVEDKQAHLHAV